MTRGKWVLLRGLLGPMGMFCLAFWVDAASLSGIDSANEKKSFGVCANLCDFNPVVEPCEVFCTSRRQFSIQSNIIVTGEKDLLVKDVGVGVADGARRKYACPFSICLSSICECCSEAKKNSESSRQEVHSPKPVRSKKICEVINKDNKYLRLILGCQNVHCCGSICGSADWTEEAEEFSEETGKTLRSVEMEYLRDEDLRTSDAARGPYVTEINDVIIEERDEVDEDFNFLGSAEDDQFTQKSEVRTRAVHIDGREDSNNYDNGFDWEKFCEIECSRGNGGAACRCDIIP